MPLPKLELKPGVTEMVTGGKCHDDIRVLLRDLYEGVYELGVGNCEVLAHDNPKATPPKFGFDLSHTTQENNFCVWEFMITAEDFKRTCESLDPALREVLTTTRGRMRVARMFQCGMFTGQVEKRLTDPTTRYIQARIKLLQELADKAQAAAQREKEEPPKRRSVLDPHPATEHFLLQGKIATLEELLLDFDVGKHL